MENNLIEKAAKDKKNYTKESNGYPIMQAFKDGDRWMEKEMEKLKDFDTWKEWKNEELKSE